MKLECVKFRKGRPYIEYLHKNRERLARHFGEIRNCKQCGNKFFASFYAIKRGEGSFCNCSCSSWKKGEIRKDGYIHIRQPQHPYAKNGYVAEHRLIMEKILDRYLLPSEIVHHINDIRDDNREENLALFSTLGEHISHHHKKGDYPYTKKIKEEKKGELVCAL